MTRKSLCRWVIVFLALMSVSLVGPASSAQGMGFSGVVVNMGNGRPIAGAQISAADHLATTDARGRYLLPLPAGVYDVHAQAPGYVGMVHRYQRLEGSVPATLDFEMVPRHPLSAESGVIDAKMRQPSQAPPTEFGARALAEGYALSAVTTVPQSVRVLMPDGSAVVMEMDEYLKGVVPREVPPYWPREALRAQAVAARSYAATRRAHLEVGADVCTTVHCQVWGPTQYETTSQAVEDTHGVVATYGGKIIYAFFFGHCDGHTRNIEEVWGVSVPYCRSVSCPCGFSFLWGHGVGMCQEGARTLAAQGRTYAEILQHYYTGVNVAASAPDLVSGGFVSPASGNESTEFTYQVSYASASGQSPALAQVIVDGHAHTLVRVSTGVAQPWLYRFTTTLSAGNHNFRFTFDDGYGRVSTLPADGTLSGPAVAEGTSPTPVPGSPPEGVRLYDITRSTASDWEQGTHAGTRVVAVGDGALALQEGQTQGVYDSGSLSVPFPFVALGFSWYADTPLGASLFFEVRTSSDGLAWGEWHTLRASEDDPGQRNVMSSDLLFGEGSLVAFRVRLRAGPGGESPILKSLRLVCIDSQPGPTALELAALHTAMAGQPLPVIPRSAWGADESLMTWPPEYRSPRAVVLHHTATEDGGVDPAAVVRAIYVFHATVREWGDIGYNYLIDHLGNIYEGRAGGVGVVGAHAKIYNWGSIGIGLIGDHQENAVPSAMLDRLTGFLAWQCAEYLIDPLEQRLFIDAVLPNIMGHRDCGDTTCPGDLAYALLPTIRTQTFGKMATVPPNVTLLNPSQGQAVRAVVNVSPETSGVVNRAEYWLDGALREVKTAAPFNWRWHTLGESETTHELRVVVYNGAGQSEDGVEVTVDNTPPSGSATAPDWSASSDVAFSVSSPDAAGVQFSNGWVWEGEELAHQPGTGLVVADAAALNGLAWDGRGGADQPGAWFGPYACALPAWQSYQVYFRLKTPDRSPDAGLATLDVVDDQGRRVYAQMPLAARDFSRSNVYEDLRLNLEYQGQWPSCDDPGIQDGLEFRTWFSGARDLALDRVAVFGAPRPVSVSPVHWTVEQVEGPQAISIRFLDAAGNAFDQALTVNLDLTPPAWGGYASRKITVQDSLSGLDTSSAMWATSSDEGITWGEWQALEVQETSGITEPVELAVPWRAATHLRFRISDVAGNSSVSEPQPISRPPSTPVDQVAIPVIVKRW